ncbi:unnamed protein product [Phaedon cochleariae]|uniref:Uncharacterized protein n=1 Tax=Phaedon cochleariae TaxID=80249 RepID=A0A9P0GRC5_PHACE|nr:unnamed protein product [Phaedon cochleariae]
MKPFSKTNLHTSFKIHRMLVHWKSLLGFGFAFWILLCLNDFLGGKNHGYYMEYETDSDNDITKDSDWRAIVSKFGISMLIWNTITFIFSLIFCYLITTLGRFIWRISWSSRIPSENAINQLLSTPIISEQPSTSLSKIPVIIKPLPTNSRSSDTDLKMKPKVHSDASCPNLLPKRTPSNMSHCTSMSLPQCHTLFKNNKLFSPTAEENDKLDRHLEIQCTKLRSEMVKLQASFLKERSIISRKLETAGREKKELSKQLTVAQKENRAAKQQMEELLQEKGVLIKKLENATKEFKSNIKTKKYALAKLEEVTTNVDNLKQQLQQVSRDKEILENKLKVLESEYEKLQERFILSNQTNFSGSQEHAAERDMSATKDRNTAGNSETFNGAGGNTASTKDSSLVSQADLDMKKIQVKIQQLEKNLENFNKADPNNQNGAQTESEISLLTNNSDTMRRTEDDTDYSEYYFPSPRIRFWGGRAGDVIQTLARGMNEKVRFLDNIKERCETEIDEYSSQESLDDIRCPTRMVSSSVAFQNFLKCLQPSDVRRQFGSQTSLNIQM